MNWWIDSVSKVLAAIKADDVSLKLQNEFFEKDYASHRYPAVAGRKEHGSKKTKASAEWIRALHDLASSTRAEDSVRKRGSDSTYAHLGLSELQLISVLPTYRVSPLE